MCFFPIKRKCFLKFVHTKRRAFPSIYIAIPFQKNGDFYSIRSKMLGQEYIQNNRDRENNLRRL